MAPDLAVFTASHSAGGGGVPAWDDVVAAVTASLERSFTVVPDRTASRGTERRTWFDTFDWLLFRAGLLLEYVPARRGSELRLIPGGDSAGRVVVQPVSGWQPSQPHQARDLPPGALADRVGKIIAPRVLLPVATVTETAVVSRLLNADDKTVARLVIERPALSARGKTGGETSGTTSRPLAPRFTIRPVRGYTGQGRRAVRLLEETEGVTQASGTVLEEALAVRGRAPGDYSNKVKAPVTASMPAAQAVATVLLRLLDMMEANAHGVVKDIDPEFLHDFRVAVRRTRAALKLFGEALDGALDVAGPAAEFKWLGDLTTPTRDLDVHLLGFDDMTAGLRAAKPDDLEPFRSYLRDRRAREWRALARGLRSPRYRALTTQWRDTLTPVAERGRRRPGGMSAAFLAAERTRRAFAKVARRGAAITSDSPHESLHDLRKRCKELRYALEFFTPLYDPGTYGKVVGDLKKLQDCLGNFQDSEVQIEEIRALATAMQAAGEAPAVTLLAMGELTAGLAESQATARADFEQRFAAFAGIDGQRRMSVLLRGGVTA